MVYQPAQTWGQVPIVNKTPYADVNGREDIALYFVTLSTNLDSDRGTSPHLVLRRQGSGTHWSRASNWVRSYVPRVLCSPGPMFPRTYVPRVRCSPILCSPVPMFPGTCEPLSYVPRYLCSPVLCSPVPMFPVPMFPGTYVPPYLCSPVSPLTIMPSTYVPHP